MKCRNREKGLTVLVRVYGQKTDLIIDREAEMIVKMLFSKFNYNKFRLL